MSAAAITLKHDAFSSSAVTELARGLTRQQTRELAVRHMSAYLNNPADARRVRHNPPRSLSAEEEEEAMEILGNYILKQGHVHFFRTVREALTLEHKGKQRLTQLVELYGSTPAAFGLPLHELVPPLPNSS